MTENENSSLRAIKSLRSHLSKKLYQLWAMIYVFTINFFFRYKIYCMIQMARIGMQGMVAEKPWGNSAHTYTGGGQSKKFAGNQRCHFSFMQPKMWAHFMAFYTLGMQINIRIAYKERRNISLTTFDTKKYQEHNFSIIWTQKCNFRRYFNQEISDLPSSPMCRCSVPSPGQKRFGGSKTSQEDDPMK